MRWSTSGLEVQKRELPNQVLQSHRTSDSRKGLVAHSGAKLVVSNMTSDREVTEIMRMRSEQRETNWKQRSYGENEGDMAPSWILTVN